MCRSILLFPVFLNFWLVIVSTGNTLEYNSFVQQKSQDFLFYENIYSELYFEIRKKVFDFNERNIKDFQLRNISTACLFQIAKLANDLQTRETWALQVLDSFGKPKSGLLQGALFWEGEYTECLRVTENYKDKWKSKYCFLGPTVNFGYLLNDFRYGICMEQSCSNDDIAELANYALSLLPNVTSLLPIQINQINSTYVNCIEPRKLDPLAKFVISILSIFLIIVFIATLVEVLIVMTDRKPIDSISKTELSDTDKPHKNKKARNLFLEILLSFSAYRNSPKIFNITKRPDQFHCLHAIRYLSIGWVVLGHTFQGQFILPLNPTEELEFKKSPFIMFISSATFSVDTFFLLSGMLGAYMFLKELSKPSAKLSFSFMAKYYFHRFWRLTPPYMVAILISAFLVGNLGNGPFYPETFEYNKCRDNWWGNLLYINNLYYSNYQCFGISWYLSNDMQFHWIAPIILISLSFKHSKKAKIFAFIMCGVLLVISLLTTALTINAYPGLEKGIRSNESLVYYDKVYIKPWCRIGPFVIGIILGYLVHQYKIGKGFILNTKISLIGWFVSIVLIGVMVFAIYPDINGAGLSRVSLLLYETFKSITWAVCAAFMIYACIVGKGWFINKFLSFSIWIPLSRLSYCTYLIHLIIYSYYNYIQEHPLFLTKLNLAYTYVGHLVFSLIAAFFLSICFELPFIELENCFYKKKKIKPIETGTQLEEC